MKAEIQETLETIAKVQNNRDLLLTLKAGVEACLSALKSGHKIIFAGNGGSAADSQHLAAELVGRLNFDRPTLPALSLTVDTSALTAIGNDYGYDAVFARQLEALGQRGDIFIALSTSGGSKNVIEALKVAQRKEIFTIGLTGQTGGAMGEYCHLLLKIPSQKTAKIQECHLMLGHILCSSIEKSLFEVQGFLKKTTSEGLHLAV